MIYRWFPVHTVQTLFCLRIWTHWVQSRQSNSFGYFCFTLSFLSYGLCSEFKVCLVVVVMNQCDCQLGTGPLQMIVVNPIPTICHCTTWIVFRKKTKIKNSLSHHRDEWLLLLASIKSMTTRWTFHTIFLSAPRMIFELKQHPKSGEKLRRTVLNTYAYIFCHNTPCGWLFTDFQNSESFFDREMA